MIRVMLCEYLVGLSTTSSSSNARGVTRRKQTVIVHAANNIHITGQKHEVVACMHAARCQHLLARQHMYDTNYMHAVTTQPQLCRTCTFHLLSRDLSDGPCPSYPAGKHPLIQRGRYSFQMLRASWFEAIGRTVYVIST